MMTSPISSQAPIKRMCFLEGDRIHVRKEPYSGDISHLVEPQRARKRLASRKVLNLQHEGSSMELGQVMLKGLMGVNEDRGEVAYMFRHDPNFDPITKASMGDVGRLRPLFLWLEAAGIDIKQIRPEDIFIYRHAGGASFDATGTGGARVEDMIRLGHVVSLEPEMMDTVVESSTVSGLIYEFRKALPVYQEQASHCSEEDGSWRCQEYNGYKLDACMRAFGSRRALEYHLYNRHQVPREKIPSEFREQASYS